MITLTSNSYILPVGERSTIACIGQTYNDLLCVLQTVRGAI